MGSPRRRFSLVVGIGAVVLGATLTLKPFSSLDALVIYIAVALVVTGVGELVSEEEAPAVRELRRQGLERRLSGRLVR